MFDPTQLMLIVDAIMNYSAGPNCRDHAVMTAHLDGILDVCEEELAKRGYRYEGSTTYTVTTR